MFLFLILFGEYLRLQVNVWALLRALACTKGASRLLAVSWILLPCPKGNDW